MAYSSIVLDRFFNPRNIGTLPQPSTVGEIGTPGEGNFFQLFLQIDNGIITAAKVKCFTCPVAVAAADMGATLLQGTTISAAREITPEDIANALGGVPEEKMSRCRWVTQLIGKALANVQAGT